MGSVAQKKKTTGLLESEDLPGSWDTALLYGGPTSMEQLLFPPHPSPTFWTQLVCGYLAVLRLCLGSPNTGYTKPCLASKVVQEQRCLGSIGSHVGYWSSEYCTVQITLTRVVGRGSPLLVTHREGLAGCPWSKGLWPHSSAE